MKRARIALFCIALLVGALFALSLLSVRGLQKLEAGPLVRRALDEPDAARAGELARRAGALLGDDGAGGYALGRWLIERGKPQLALALLKPIVETSKGRSDFLVQGTLAWAARRAGDEALAEQAGIVAHNLAAGALDAPKKNDPDALRRFQSAGMFYAEKELGDDPKRAVQALREVLRVSPGDVTALNALGYTLADQGTTPAEFDEAVQLTRQALEKAPDDAMILDSHGWALFRQGKDLALAHRTLRRAVDLSTEELAELRYHLAAIAQKRGRIDEARIEVGRALRIDASHAAARALQAALGAAPKASPSPAPRQP